MSYAGDNARACAPQFVYLSQCVSIASECAKIITRNCEPRVKLRLQGMPTYNRGAPSPGYLFYLSDNTPLWANRECGCAGNDWLFIITRGIRVISCAQATVKNRTPASVSRKITVVFHRAFVYFIWTLVALLFFFFYLFSSTCLRKTLSIVVSWHRTDAIKFHITHSWRLYPRLIF